MKAEHYYEESAHGELKVWSNSKMERELEGASLGLSPTTPRMPCSRLLAGGYLDHP